MTSDFKCYFLTWNVGESNPPENLVPLLGLDKPELPDLYAIGLQELKSNTSNLLVDSIFDDTWTISITDALWARGYVRIKSLRLIGIHLAVYIKRTDLQYITDIESEYTRTGLGGFWGNKGGVSIRLDAFGVNLCIVNSHFSAHMENYIQRIEDYNQIILTQKYRDENSSSILDHDYVFWMGDLNFRLDDISNDMVRKKILEKDYDHLLKYDQLNRARSKELIFIGFEEGKITFQPTYKFDLNKDVYDTSMKSRVPSWCDRVLWRVQSDAYESARLSVEQISYKDIPQYKSSDHKPVFSTFIIKVLKHVPELPVLFEPLGTWCLNEDNTVTYTILTNFPSTSKDWIGLYRKDFKHFEDYAAYEWASKKGENLNDGTIYHSVLFDRRNIDHLSERTYIMLYFSSVKNCVVGYSNEFKLSTSKDICSSSSEEDLMKGHAIGDSVDRPDTSLKINYNMQDILAQDLLKENEKIKDFKYLEEITNQDIKEIELDNILEGEDLTFNKFIKSDEQKLEFEIKNAADLQNEPVQDSHNFTEAYMDLRKMALIDKELNLKTNFDVLNQGDFNGRKVLQELNEFILNDNLENITRSNPRIGDIPGFQLNDSYDCISDKQKELLIEDQINVPFKNKDLKIEEEMITAQFSKMNNQDNVLSKLEDKDSEIINFLNSDSVDQKNIDNSSKFHEIYMDLRKKGSSENKSESKLNDYKRQNPDDADEKQVLKELNEFILDDNLANITRSLGKLEDVSQFEIEENITDCIARKEKNLLIKDLESKIHSNKNDKVIYEEEFTIEKVNLVKSIKSEKEDIDTQLPSEVGETGLNNFSQAYMDLRNQALKDKEIYPPLKYDNIEKDEGYDDSKVLQELNEFILNDNLVDITRSLGNLKDLSGFEIEDDNDEGKWISQKEKDLLIKERENHENEKICNHENSINISDKICLEDSNQKIDLSNYPECINTINSNLQKNLQIVHNAEKNLFNLESQIDEIILVNKEKQNESTRNDFEDSYMRLREQAIINKLDNSSDINQDDPMFSTRVASSYSDFFSKDKSSDLQNELDSLLIEANLEQFSQSFADFDEPSNKDEIKCTNEFVTKSGFNEINDDDDNKRELDCIAKNEALLLLEESNNSQQDNVDKLSLKFIPECLRSELQKLSNVDKNKLTGEFTLNWKCPQRELGIFSERHESFVKIASTSPTANINSNLIKTLDKN